MQHLKERLILFICWVWLMEPAWLTVRKLCAGIIFLPLSPLFLMLRYPRFRISVGSPFGRLIGLGQWDGLVSFEQRRAKDLVPLSYIIYGLTFEQALRLFVYVLAGLWCVCEWAVESLDGYLRRTERPIRINPRG